MQVHQIPVGEKLPAGPGEFTYKIGGVVALQVFKCVTVGEFTLRASTLPMDLTQGVLFLFLFIHNFINEKFLLAVDCNRFWQIKCPGRKEGVVIFCKWHTSKVWKTGKIFGRFSKSKVTVECFVELICNQTQTRSLNFSEKDGISYLEQNQQDLGKRYAK